MKLSRIVYIAFAALFALGCNSNPGQHSPAQDLSDSIKIVSLNGALSEVLVALGLEQNIAGTDITSNYPESLKSKPKLGHNKNINVEGLIALAPDLIVGLRKEMTPAMAVQFKAAGIRLLLVDQEYSVAGTKQLIHTLADSLDREAKGDAVVKALENDLARLKVDSGTVKKPGVLFIYARGTGTMMVGGTGTQVDKAIALAGGRNAVTEFADYKPLTAEALVKANPDVILLFDSGLASVGGAVGLAKVQGIAETNAGRNKRIVSMDGELLSSFGPRLGIALQELAARIK